MRKLTKEEINKLKIGDLVSVKILFCNQIDFITGNTMAAIVESFQMCKVVYKTDNLLYLQMNDEIRVVDTEQCEIYR